MLTLKRNFKEWITITVPPSTMPRTIRIQLVEAESAKMGFEADRDIQILRDDAKQRERIEREGVKA